MIVTMPRVFKLLAVLLLGACAWSARGELPQPVLQALRTAGIPTSAVGAVVQEAGATRPELLHEARDSMNPASVMKLVTTYSALELLGPAYRWKTEAYVDGNDVVLKGYGDPKLNLESFWMLLRALRGPSHTPALDCGEVFAERIDLRDWQSGEHQGLIGGHQVGEGNLVVHRLFHDRRSSAADHEDHQRLFVHGTQRFQNRFLSTHRLVVRLGVTAGKVPIGG